MEIRRSYDRLISTMGFPILVRWHLYIESGPRILNEAKLETRVITIGERLGGMWSVCRPKLGHPARRDWGQGELAESPNTPNVTVAIGDVGEQSVRGASFIFNRTATATIDAILDWKGTWYFWLLILFRRQDLIFSQSWLLLLCQNRFSKCWWC